MDERRIQYQDYTPRIHQSHRVVYVLDENNVAYPHIEVEEPRRCGRVPLLCLIFLVVSCLILLVSYLLTSWDKLDNIS